MKAALSSSDGDREDEQAGAVVAGGAVFTYAHSLVVNDVELDGNNAKVGSGIYWEPYTSFEASLDKFTNLPDAAILRSF